MKSGTGLVITLFMKEVMSARTWLVGPLWPRSEGLRTDLPQPLGEVRIVGWDKRYGHIPLVECVDFDAFGDE